MAARSGLGWWRGDMASISLVKDCPNDNVRSYRNQLIIKRTLVSPKGRHTACRKLQGVGATVHRVASGPPSPTTRQPMPYARASNNERFTCRCRYGGHDGSEQTVRCSD